MLHFRFQLRDRYLVYFLSALSLSVADKMYPINFDFRVLIDDSFHTRVILPDMVYEHTTTLFQAKTCEPYARIFDYRVKAMEDSAQQARDEWLALRSRDGDFRALNRLVIRLQHRLWRYACRIPRNETEAWEFIQEA